ncbi:MULTISPECIES: glucans biosynthesis glucosyltransferase MdoH [unclassified Marinobacter]|uniref:glucans biosynthesis glucosyltransferase MdoH n=1 Tax=unclassified Marinobacter TaxID=83889 RepID=UPI001925875C|nr:MULTISPECIES: glucans biosynthesis glucosyltransferase MdoH [unclassified Marinobacter]MBL3825490.1 glucans biosynthesis glucosyltransferase MdoH [Marinobacter sp. MC3]MBL3893996.1 glucans biosynthesis glucosyltransferase MdoH [Marinobacter sp. MW3]
MAEVPGATLSQGYRWRHIAFARRSLLILFVLGQTAVASYYLLWVLPYHGGTWLELGMTALFAILYAWIAVGFWTAVFGFVLRLTGGDRHGLLRRHNPEALAATPLAKTAILLPIYHEPVEWTLSGLKAVYRDIERTGRIEHFEFYILSDSRDPDVWLEEQRRWHELARELGAEGRLFYRRRPVNLNYKSGNVADFLRRWGRRCKYMVVLDADSLLSGDTVVRMVQLMEREPGVGILQTNPTIINGKSLFARVQQFANRFYSTLFATGLAAIQMGDAAFWGHNAILRTEPFMKHCGLPKLGGFGIFGGPIMSHDFVEAAFMGRAGYEVWLETGFGNSFEESPPTLADELSRDNRWAKGNLQHLWVMFREPGLRFAHRMAFLNGVMAYLASPLWFGFLVLTTLEAARMTLAPIEYFPEGHQGPFPLWPEWRPDWALVLALSTFALLFLPKFLAILDAVLHRYTREFGGFLRLFASVLLEIVISILLAPVRMWAHSRYVVAALLNLSLSWSGQNRTEETTWRQALVTQFPGMLVGGCWSAFALSLDKLFFLWSLPVAIPLLVAAPTAVYLSRIGPGSVLKAWGLLRIPEEREPPLPLLDDARTFRSEPVCDSVWSPFEQAVLNPGLNRLHRALAKDHRRGPRSEKLMVAVDRCLEKGPSVMSRAELSGLARDSQSLADLHKGAWRAPERGYWGQCITRRSHEQVSRQDPVSG